MLVALIRLLRWRPWDPRMPIRAAERALAAKVGTGVRFRCRREEKDVSIDFMNDVDCAS